MVTAKESQTCQPFSAWNSSCLDYMALPQLEKNHTLTSFPASRHTTDGTFMGQSANLPGFNTDQQDAVGGFIKLKPPYCNISYPTGNPYLKDSQSALSHGLEVTDKPVDGSSAPKKMFLIFDQSGDHTKLFFSPSFCPERQILATKSPASAVGLCREVAAQVDQQFSTNHIVEEKWDENILTDGEDEMLEDTDEINALLYSDSDDDNEYDDNDSNHGKNNEVTSTRQSPFNTEDGCNEDKLLDELTEKVTSSDYSQKRQRLLDGEYKKSSLKSAECPMKQAISNIYEDDVESSCAGHRNSYDEIDSNKREKKLKIRQALKILETIIPGLDSKDPLSIIDKAVAYLKSMKTEAEALKFSYLECNSAISP